MNAGDPWAWYFEIPVVSRAYFTASFLTTAACALELISPLTLYFDYALIVEKGQLWRLVTHFLFFGMFSLDFLFHMYFLVRYCRLLEENSFRGRTADFVCFILFGMVLMTLFAPFLSILFFGSSLTFMMVYIWGRRNEHVRMSFLGLFPFNAPYLPWVLFTFSLVLGNSATVDLMGITAGHLYFYFDDVYPSVAEIRGWPVRRYLRFSEYFPPAPDDIQVEAAGRPLDQPLAPQPQPQPREEPQPQPREEPQPQEEQPAEVRPDAAPLPGPGGTEAEVENAEEAGETPQETAPPPEGEAAAAVSTAAPQAEPQGPAAMGVNDAAAAAALRRRHAAAAAAARRAAEEGDDTL